MKSQAPNQKHLLLALAGSAFASGVGIRIVDPIVVALAAEYAISVASASLLVTAFAVSYAVGLLVVGPLGDAFGKVRLVILCSALSAVLIAACAAAPGLASLLWLRALSGFTAGGIVPLSAAIVLDRVDAQLRQIALARFIMAPILGQLAGGALSGFVAEWWNWRAVFVLTAVMLLASALAVFAVAGIRRRSEPEALSLARLAHRYKLVFETPRAFSLYGLVLTGSVAAYGIFPYIGDILGARQGSGPSEAGLVIAGFGMGGLVYGLSVRRLVFTIGPRRMVAVGGMGVGGALAAFALPLFWAWSVPVFFAMGVSFFMLHNTMSTQISELAPPARGTALAVFAACAFTAQGIGPALIGALLHVVSMEHVLLLLAATAVCAGMLARKLVREACARSLPLHE